MGAGCIAPAPSSYCLLSCCLTLKCFVEGNPSYGDRAAAFSAPQLTTALPVLTNMVNPNLLSIYLSLLTTNDQFKAEKVNKILT